MISLIVAHDKNRLIGNANKLPWHLPADLKFFVEKTLGKVVIMGRKTLESIGKPLPKRINVVLTRDKNYKCKDVIVFNDFKYLCDIIPEEDEVFVIGGSEIYNLFLPIADKLYVTYIDAEFNGDAYFPEYENRFKLHKEVKGKRDGKNNYDFYFREYLIK